MTWPRRLRSVRVRITILTTAALAIGLLITAVALLAVLRRSLLDAQAGSGPRRAAELAALASKEPLPNPLPAIDADPPTVLQMLGTDGSVVAASSQLQGADALLPASARGRRVLHELPGLGDETWLAEPTPATVGGRPVVLIVLTSLAGYDRGVRLLRNSLLVTVPVLIVVVAALVWWVVGRALRPVETMRLEVARITGERLDRRVRQPVIADEIGRLAGTLNDMLDRLQSSRDAQRRFVADASHELRTPIANIRVALEVAAAHPDRADWPGIADDVLRQDDRMERLTADLLALARAEAARGSPATTTRVDLARLVADELDRPLPGGVRLASAGPVPDIEVLGDHDQLARVLSNLVDNALRHARRHVTIALSRGSAWAEIRVVDDGPGIAAEDRDSVFEPFVRLDAHRTRSGGGTGLGLSIVREVVRAHRGSVQVLDNDPGAVFVVRLPLQ
ncbi:MAG: integral rane sensor signal transduction histidine kinase [Ilumatobacteraceae bacterium]|nr:integral rane sensor signal transduction histidine kinase [Ilumatobacteraceae bacterium]